MADAPTDLASVADAVPAMLVQQNAAGNMSAMQVTVSLANLPDASHILIAIGGSANGNPSISGAANWTFITHSNTSATESIWVGTPNGSSATAVLTNSAVERVWLSVTEWSGIDQVNPVDGSNQSGSGLGTTGTLDLAVPTTSAPDLVVFSEASFNTFSNPTGSVWHNLDSIMASNVTQQSWYQLAWAPGSDSVHVMYPGDYDSVIVAFRTKP